MKDLESQARLIQGSIERGDPQPLRAVSRAVEASRAYHTNMRLVGLREMTLSGLINEVGDVRAQGPSDALVLAVHAMKQAAASRNPQSAASSQPSSPVVAQTPRPPAFRNILHRRLHRPQQSGDHDDAT